jgi:hypothetical protein
MTDTTDMSTPVTRGELRSEIEGLERRLEHRLAVTKTELDAKIATLVTKDDLKVELETWGKILLSELARHANAIEESMRREISVIDDKYADLPGRVSRLESVVLTRKRR